MFWTLGGRGGVRVVAVVSASYLPAPRPGVHVSRNPLGSGTGLKADARPMSFSALSGLPPAKIIVAGFARNVFCDAAV